LVLVRVPTQLSETPNDPTQDRPQPRVHKVKGFVYEHARFRDNEIEISVRPHRRSRPVCSGCGRRGPGYDTLPARRFEFVPLWGLLVYLLYARRRVDHPGCGVTAERLPWADGKHHLTHA
jgi:transposase